MTSKQVFKKGDIVSEGTDAGPTSVMVVIDYGEVYLSSTPDQSEIACFSLVDSCIYMPDRLRLDKIGRIESIKLKPLQPEGRVIEL